MLEVIEPGLLTTVQDGGRPAAVSLGVPVGGACDRWGLAAANGAAGNPAAAPAIEMTLSGATFRAHAECVVGVGGAEMGGRLVERGDLVASGTAALLRPGDTLAFGTPVGSGLRGYLALAGGVDVPAVLGSASTCLVGGFGGIEGRALRAGDSLRAARHELPHPRPWRAPPALLGDRLRVVRGPHADRLAGTVFDELVAGDWRVSARGDRQGIRLDGGPVNQPPVGSMLSHGVVWGAIQLPPDGQPIVLLADHQTVGGYPVVAVVISADLPTLGQLGAGDELRLVEVSASEAHLALVQQRRALAAAMAHAVAG